MNSKYKPVTTLLSKLLTNPLMEDINESDLAIYITDAIKLIGAPNAYENKECDIDIINHRGKLPDDMIYIIQSLFINGNKHEPMSYSTSSYSSKYHQKGSYDLLHLNNKSYDLNNHYIITNDKTGKIRLFYKGLAIDSNKIPLIPDNIKFEKAIEAYVKLQHYTVLWELGKIPDKVFSKVEQEYSWYVGAAQTAGQLMSMDEAENFTNTFTRLLLKPFKNDFFDGKTFKEKLNNI